MGVVVPFYDMAMKSNTRKAYSFLPGRVVATYSNFLLSYLDWKPSLNSFFYFLGMIFLGGCFFFWE
jgi:hypothetical protein